MERKYWIALILALVVLVTGATTVIVYAAIDPAKFKVSSDVKTTTMQKHQQQQHMQRMMMHKNNKPSWKPMS